MFRRSVTFCERGATPASAAGGGYRERGLAQRSASGKAALSAADGAGRRKRAGSEMSASATFVRKADASDMQLAATRNNAAKNAPRIGLAVKHKK